VRNSEPDFAATIARLQQSYERQYRPGPQETLAALTERLSQPETQEHDVAECIEALRLFYEQRFGQQYAPERQTMREHVATLVAEIEEREAARRDALALIAAELEQSAAHDERLRAALQEIAGP